VPFSLLLVLHADALEVVDWSEPLRAFVEYLGVKRASGGVLPVLDVLVDDVCAYALRFDADSKVKNSSHTNLIKLLNELALHTGHDKTRYATQRIVTGLVESIKRALSPELMAKVSKGEDISAISDLEDALSYFICYAAYSYFCFGASAVSADRNFLVTAKDRTYILEFTSMVQRVICETPDSLAFFNH
jgi:hypothetical protein